jgi:DNA-binding NarL/FixJ family response regulator
MLLNSPITEQLDARQINILRKVARGKTYKEIAASLNLSETTIKHQMNKILSSLQFETRTEAILYLQKFEFANRRN